MVFTCRIEVFEVKPNFHVSCIINSLICSHSGHVFPEETFLYSRKNQVSRYRLSPQGRFVDILGAGVGVREALLRPPSSTL